MPRVVLVLVIAGLAACSSRSSGYLVGPAVCVSAASTVDLPAGGQGRAADAIAGCRTWPDFDQVAPLVRGMCGPCGFTFDRAFTERERAAGRGAVCCYDLASPPPPPPSPTSRPPEG